MSENIVIQEGGIGKQLAADKLKVNKAGGGTCLYVLEGSTVLGTKNITANGSYSAEDDGYAGYSQVYVNVSDGGGGGGGGGSSVVGRDSDGDEAVVTTDPDTEAFVITKIPSSIRVITPPTNPYGTYIDGQTITKDGMVVKAYSATGTDMGEVPLANVTMAPTTATYDPSTDTIGRGIARSELGEIPFLASESAFFSFYREGSEPAYQMHDFDTGYKFVAVNGSPCWFGPTTQLNYTYQDRNGAHSTHLNGSWRNCDPVELGGYASSTTYDASWSQQLAAQMPACQTDLSIDQIAGIMKAGEVEMLPSGSTQTITVTWNRPGDNKALEASFTITVGPRAGQGDD